MTFDKTQPNWWNGVGVTNDRAKYLDDEMNNIATRNGDQPINLHELIDESLSLAGNDAETSFIMFVIGFKIGVSVVTMPQNQPQNA